jgi:hypothetical protein
MKLGALHSALRELQPGRCGSQPGPTGGLPDGRVGEPNEVPCRQPGCRPVEFENHLQFVVDSLPASAP